MFRRIFIVLFFSLFLSGCLESEVPMPEIVQGYVVKPVVFKRPPAEPVKTPERPRVSVPSDWVPPSRLERVWTAIVIHHSVTTNGNVALFDKFHRETKHWKGVGYDFVIGNGTNSGDGQVEVTYRWRNQETGAHVGGTPGNWANEEAVGICLVGDFNRVSPTVRQLRSLSRLVRFLQERCRISKSRVYGHNTTPGARVTDCPGKRFPMARLKSTLRN